jgi:hypothetical protein
MSTPAGEVSPKVDKPPSPQTEKTMPDALKPSNPNGAQGYPGAGSAPTSPTHATLDHDLVGASSVMGPAKSPRVSPPSPRSHGLGAADEYQRGEGSSVPQPEEVLRQHSWVAESLWDNPDFIQARFHTGQFVTAAIDTEADQENIKELYSSLKTTLDQIDISALTMHLIAFPCHGFDSFPT